MLIKTFTPMTRYARRAHTRRVKHERKIATFPTPCYSQGTKAIWAFRLALHGYLVALLPKLHTLHSHCSFKLCDFILLALLLCVLRFAITKIFLKNKHVSIDSKCIEMQTRSIQRTQTPPRQKHLPLMSK